jgi:hypothetical protein
MSAAEWFPGAQLNYAEHVLRGGTDQAVARTLIDPWCRALDLSTIRGGWRMAAPAL